jgi:hypothetical protein
LTALEWARPAGQTRRAAPPLGRLSRTYKDLALPGKAQKENNVPLHYRITSAFALFTDAARVTVSHLGVMPDGV